MAKPTIYFKGAKWTASGQTGWRPRLETPPVIADLALCEEIVLQQQMMMSPEELLHAVRTVLETAPGLVAKDGSARSISKLIKWSRSAKGQLDSQAGAWNDTCKAQTTASLLSAAKYNIDANFVNSDRQSAPRLNYVAYPGASQAVDVVKKLKPIVAYGRLMKFDASIGDTAQLFIDGTHVYNLTCTTSDAAHAEFAWPNIPGGVEAGTSATFIMTSRGGEAEAPVTLNKKTVVILEQDPTVQPVIGGVTQIMEDLIDFGDMAMTISGSGLTINAGAGDWVHLVHNAMTNDITADITANTAELITLGHGFQNRSGYDESDWRGTWADVVVHTSGGEATRRVQFAGS